MLDEGATTLWERLRANGQPLPPAFRLARPISCRGGCWGSRRPSPASPRSWSGRTWPGSSTPKASCPPASATSKCGSSATATAGFAAQVRGPAGVPLTLAPASGRKAASSSDSEQATARRPASSTPVESPPRLAVSLRSRRVDAQGRPPMAYVQDQIVPSAELPPDGVAGLSGPLLRRQVACAVPTAAESSSTSSASPAGPRPRADSTRTPSSGPRPRRSILLRKNQQALGKAFIREDRTKAIDYLGFASQLVFTTFCLGNFQLEYGDDVDFASAAATAHNRMMTDFCSVTTTSTARHRLRAADGLRAAPPLRPSKRSSSGPKAILIRLALPQGPIRRRHHRLRRSVGAG